MCGIIGYIGQNNAIKVLHEGLKNLEYRGYDSAGISCFDGNKLLTIKKAGSVDNLFESIKTFSNIGIGHTRWATHGKATDQNAHPHESEHKLLSIVHNGIIENFEELKQQYLNDYNLKSETDTEIIANLLERFSNKEGSFVLAIQKVEKLLKGTFAICILKRDEPNRIYYARKDSPLLVGKGDDEMFLSSDINGFLKYTKTCYEIENNAYGYITHNSVVCHKFCGVEIQPKCKKVLDANLYCDKKGFKHFMLKEIYEIPTAIKNTANLYESDFNPFNNISSVFWDNINRIKIVACGTSYHSGLIGAKLIEQQLKIDTTCHIASEFIYEEPIITNNTLCIFISQSGETADTLTAIKLAKSLGAKTLGITNVKTSTINSVCDAILPTLAGAEIAVASTKAYNTQVFVFYLLVNYLKNSCKLDKIYIAQIVDTFEKLNIKKMERTAKQLAKKIASYKSVFFVGRNFDYVSSLESSLKLKEISYINCSGYASGELKHGTIALVDSNSLTIAFVTENKLMNKTLNVVNQICARDGDVIIITQLNKKYFNNKKRIELPNINEEFVPLISVLPMQLLAYHTSILLGNNPDKPRNLAKSVTVE